MGNPMRPMPIQPIFWVLFAIRVSWSLAGLSLGQCAARFNSHACRTMVTGPILNVGMTEAVSTADTRVATVAPAREGRLHAAARNAIPFLVVGAIWEAAAHAGLFPARLFP